jgi:hypothetical protein
MTTRKTYGKLKDTYVLIHNFLECLQCKQNKMQAFETSIDLK